MEAEEFWKCGRGIALPIVEINSRGITRIVKKIFAYRMMINAFSDLTMNVENDMVN